MPLDLISVFEALGLASQFLPTDYEGRYRRLASHTVQEILSVLTSSLAREPFHVEAEDSKRFKAAKAHLVALVSNPPIPPITLHAALKPLLTDALAFSRSLTLGIVSKQQAVAFQTRAKDHLAQHHRNHE